MHRLTLLLVLSFACMTQAYAQTNLLVRLNGDDGLPFDSTTVLLEDGTGDTTYGRIPVSDIGQSWLVIGPAGEYLLKISAPGFVSLGVPLVINGKVTDTMEVMLTPLSQPLRESRIDFRNGSSLMAKFALLHMNSIRRLVVYEDQRYTFVTEGGDESKFEISWKGVEAQKILEALSREKEPLLRDELMIQYMELNNLKNEKASTDTIKSWLSVLPPASPAWVYHYNLAFSAYFYTWDREKFFYQDRVVAEHKDRYFRAEMLYWLSRIYRSMDDMKKFDSTVAILSHSYSSTGWAEKAYLLLQPDLLRVGDTVPAFNLKSMDDTLTTVSSSGMLGRMYLIDFWGTWCGMCLHEMPFLHNAYSRFAKQGFTILSISSDASADRVRKFRKGKWKMPWLNAFVGDRGERPLVKAFGVRGWPTPVLVDGKGKIVALGYEQLTGDRLERTIAMHIGK